MSGDNDHEVAARLGTEAGQLLLAVREELADATAAERKAAGDKRSHDYLIEALAQLPSAQRQTFVLHAEAELSYREVAETLDISIGTVMSRLYYARQRLRVLLEPWVKPQ